VQFGKKLSEFDIIKGKIAGMATRLYATESLAYAVAGNMDRGAKDYSLEAACGKVFSSECAWHVADETIQVLGGLGFMQSYPTERVMRDLRIFRIFEGASEILRLFVALNGLQTAGNELKPLQQALKQPLANLGTLVPAAISMAKARAGMPDTPTLPHVHPSLRGGASIVEENTGKFGAAVRELLMAYGKGVIDKQLPLERAASVAMELTAATAALSRATRAIEKGYPTAELEKNLANGFAMEAGARCRTLIAEMNPASSTVTKLDKLRAEIASSVFKAGQYPATPPLGF
jgi:very long chain acyl-CoA dehydrogenase